MYHVYVYKQSFLNRETLVPQRHWNIQDRNINYFLNTKDERTFVWIVGRNPRTIQNFLVKELAAWGDKLSASTVKIVLNQHVTWKISLQRRCLCSETGIEKRDWSLQGTTKKKIKPFGLLSSGKMKLRWNSWNSDQR